jgi:hypothetical protein
MALLDVQDTTAPSTDPVIVVRYVLFFMPRFFLLLFFFFFFFFFSFLSIVCSYSTCSNFPSLPVKRKKERKSGNEAAQLGNLFRVT